MKEITLLFNMICIHCARTEYCSEIVTGEQDRRIGEQGFSAQLETNRVWDLYS